MEQTMEQLCMEECKHSPKLREIKTLAQLKPEESGVIVKVKGHGAFRKRIIEMGFVKGKKVTVIKQAPLNDPMEYEIMGYNLSLRRSEAALIEVVEEPLPEECVGELTLSEIESRVQSSAAYRGKNINVALVGNPNSGKTTLFNFATNSHERVGNYGGVTIAAKEGVIESSGYRFLLSDLPGTYSITEYSPEELYVRRHLFEKMPDVVINVVDASNLERNLYLTTQLLDMNIKVVIALNMYDELEQKGIELDHHKLGQLIGIPIIPTVAKRGRGVQELLQKVIEVYEDREPISRNVRVNHGLPIESALSILQEEIKGIPTITGRYSCRYLAVKVLEQDKEILALLKGSDRYQEIEKIAEELTAKIEHQYKESPEAVITDAKYGFISGALKEVMTLPETPGRKVHNLDDLLTHKYFGLPIFALFMWVMFQTTFSLGEYPMTLIEKGVALLSSFVTNNMAAGPLRDLLSNGVIDGVGGVLVFLPNILILFFFISFMEDSGYMARAAFIMDKLMHKIGLHGKSFIPLVMGFGCNVPAVMATRTLESKSDRILTMLLIPFMSCSARLPVYVLLISAFFPANKGVVLFGIYFTGILMAVLLALMLKAVVFKKEEVPFVMELPPYRIPTLKATGRHMWHKAYQYVKKMGSVILIASIVVWALGYFPHKDSSNLEESYIGKIGHSMAPIMEPLGFDWKMSVAIVGGLPAKEIVVSTMSVLYNVPEGEEGSESLVEGIKAQVHQSGPKAGQKVFDPVVALAFMVFILIYFPCVATVVAIGRESGWGWATFSLLYTTGLAWIMSYAVYNIGNMIVG